MDKFLERRFSHYNDWSLEDLEREKAKLLDDLEYLFGILDDPKASSEQKSEIRNSDIRHEEDAVTYIEYLIEKKKGSKKL